MRFRRRCNRTGRRVVISGSRRLVYGGISGFESVAVGRRFYICGGGRRPFRPFQPERPVDQVDDSESEEESKFINNLTRSCSFYQIIKARLYIHGIS